MNRRLLKRSSLLHILPLALIVMTLAVCFAELPAPVSAAPGSAVGQALLNAMPKLTDIPNGYEFKVHDTNTASLGDDRGTAYAIFDGRRTYNWYNNKTKATGTSGDTISLDASAHYSGFNKDTDPEGSADKFRAFHLTQTEMGLRGVSYQGLPGGVIFEDSKVDTSGAKHVTIFVRLIFWKSRYCTGEVYVTYAISSSYDINEFTSQPSSDSRVAEAKAFCRPQVERLAKLIYSRLPEDVIGSSGSTTTTPAIVPPVSSGSQGSQPPQTQSRGNTTSSGEPGRLPDAALPAAAGATAIIAGLGALAAALTNGVNPKEVFEDAINFFRGRSSEAAGSATVEESAQTAFDQAAYDAMIRDENLKQLQDDVDRAKDAVERRQQYIESLRQAGHMEQANKEASTLGELQREVSRTQQQLSDFGGKEADHITKKHIFDIGEDQAAKARADVIAAQAGTLSDLDRVKINDWIDLQAPDEQSAQRMRAMVQDRTVTIGNGKTVGSVEGITRELGQMLQESNQPDLRYVERFSIRDEFMDNAKTFGDARGKAQDAVGAAGGLTELAGAKMPGGLDAAAKVSDALGYWEGYRKGAGNSVSYAVVKAAAQMGVKQLALSNPVIGLGDTAFKYAEQTLLGRDASPGKALETMVNLAFDSVHDVKDRAPVIFNPETGLFEVGAKMVGIESPELNEAAAQSMLSAVDKQMSNPNLSAADRNGLSSAREDLMETLNDLRGQQGGKQ